ncbi:MAG TPA: ISAs1 family transposase [Blastocatellia bacterium]|nr:ISAs1 family transposase [Blastocatellia bacterium]
MHDSTTAVSFAAIEEAFFFDVGSLYEYLENLTDRRDPRGLRYPLAIALVFIILAKLAGEQEARGIAQWVALRKHLLAEALHFWRKTTPAAITYSRILGKAVDVAQLQQAVSRFLLASPRADELVELNLDGKALRGTIPAGQTQGLHLLAAYLPDSGVVLMQVEVGSKDNEIAAAPRLLKWVDLRGKIITGDAMFAQRGLSRLVVEAGGDYVWSVKENQPALRSSIESLFEIEEGKTRLKAMSNDLSRAETLDKQHGRLEQRRITTSSMLAGHVDWPGLAQVFKIEREVEEVATGKRRSEAVYGVTSLSAKQANAARLLEIVRKHWMIENGLHYRRDWSLREDYCRLRTGDAAQAMAVINNLVVGLVLRQGFKYLPDARRIYSARPLEGLKLILRR